MNKGKVVLITAGLVAVTVGVGALIMNLHSIPGLKNAPPALMQAVVIVVGIIAAAVTGWMVNQKFSAESKSSGAAAAGEAPAEITDLDELLDEADARLAESELGKEAEMSKLPVVIVLGETGAAKTTTIVHSGLDPELLAGQMYEENNLLPTPTANFWYARKSVFIEAAGKLMADGDAVGRIVHSLRPGKGAALLGTAREAPRAALVCVDAETLLSPSPDPLAATARKLRSRLGEISQTLGINLPVYVLFTRADRIPFFTEYVANLKEDEVPRVLGVTLPVVQGRKGVYTEEETASLNAAFERMFRALCNARPTFLSREVNPGQLGAVYEFPREFRKIRSALVRLLVEVGRPSQLTAGPFLRGFYFSGVRPVIVTEAAPVAPEAQAGSAGLTGLFRARGTPGAAPQRIAGTRKVPQWVFVSHLFNDVLLGDKVGRSASAAGVQASMPRRILLMAASFLCLAYSGTLVMSYFNNRALEDRVAQAAKGIATVDAAGQTAASLDSLQRLETVRQALETLNNYNQNGAPWGLRWGLYEGDELYPNVRRLYFTNFRKLLLLQTQNTLADSLNALPATPGPDYGPTYDSLKAYLITTSNHDRSTRAFLAPVLLNRWSANRNVEPARMQLAQKQFEFYADELKTSNPFSSDNDAMAVGKARTYLSQFAALERVYQAMLADAAKSGPAINFNRQFPGSAEVLIDNQDVGAPFTKPGWAFMKTALKNPEKYFAGEAWVLGDQSSANLDRAHLAQQLSDRYYSDFVKQWRAYFKAASVTRYASLSDAAKKLGVLSGNQSPLLALFWLASQNTAVDAPDVAKALQPAQAVVPASSVDRYIGPSNQGYMNSLVTLQASVESIAAQPQGNDAAAAQTLTNATNAKVAARQVAQSFTVDPEAHVDAMSEKLLEDPITNVEALLRNLGPAELNGKGKGLCTAFRSVLGKYPFNPAATPQATVAEVNGLFHRPDGALWKFYDENLQKLLPKQGAQYVPQSAGAVTLNPAFVSFFNQAASFSDFVYAGGSADPHFTYTLKPLPAEGIQTLGLHLDGQPFSYSGGDAAPKQFTWQSAGTHEAKATVKFGGGPDLAWSTSDGLWAIFQFFNKAETWRPSGTGNLLEWVIRIGKDPVTLPSGKPLTVRFELDMAGGPPIFQKGYFSRLACVADVAK